LYCDRYKRVIMQTIDNECIVISFYSNVRIGKHDTRRFIIEERTVVYSVLLKWK